MWGKKEAQTKVEELLKLHNISYCSTVHSKQRGDGSVIIYSSKDYTMKELKIECPDNLEVTVAFIKPRKMMDPVSMITRAVCCPPRSQKKYKLMNLISSTYHNIKTKNTNAFFLCGRGIDDLRCGDI